MVAAWKHSRAGMGSLRAVCASLALPLCVAVIAPRAFCQTGGAAEVPLALDPAQPWQPHAYRMYGFGLSRSEPPSAEQLAAMGVNLMVYRGGGFRVNDTDPRTTQSLEAIAADVAELHRHGIKAMTSTALVPLRPSPQREMGPEFLEHCVRDAQGRPYPGVSGRRGEETWLCVNHDFWLDRFERGLREQIGAGLDATHIDLAKAAICYCSVCRDKWGLFSQQRLSRSVPLEEAVKTTDPVLKATYAVFRFKSVIRFIGELHRRIDAIRPGYGLDTTNHIEDRSLYFWTHGRDAFDIACIELTAAKAEWFPPLGEELTSYRLALACLGPNHQVWGLNKVLVPSKSAVAAGVTMEEASTAGQYVEANPGENWQRLNPSPDRQRLYLAQGLAEGVMVNPQSLADHHAEAWGTRRIPYDDIISAYYRFHKTHAGEFARARSAARVAVLFSVADLVFDPPNAKYALYGLCEALLKAHVPYDVHVLEHPSEIDANAYEVLLIPAGACLSDAAVAFLAREADAGKRIIAFGPVGERTDSFLSRETPLPPSLQRVETLAVKLDELLFPFNEDRTSTAAAEIVRRVKAAAGEPIRVTHPGASRLATTVYHCDGGMLLQVLNYAIPTFAQAPEHERLKKETVIPAQGVGVDLSLPKGAAVKGVRCLSPDHPAVAAQFEQQGQRVSFTIPRVMVWETVFVDTTASGG